jgi:hypothetical protein
MKYYHDELKAWYQELRGRKDYMGEIKHGEDD